MVAAGRWGSEHATSTHHSSAHTDEIKAKYSIGSHAQQPKRAVKRHKEHVEKGMNAQKHIQQHLQQPQQGQGGADDSQRQLRIVVGDSECPQQLGILSLRVDLRQGHLLLFKKHKFAADGLQATAPTKPALLERCFLQVVCLGLVRRVFVGVCAAMTQAPTLMDFACMARSLARDMYSLRVMVAFGRAANVWKHPRGRETKPTPANIMKSTQPTHAVMVCINY